MSPNFLVTISFLYVQIVRERNKNCVPAFHPVVVFLPRLNNSVKWLSFVSKANSCLRFFLEDRESEVPTIRKNQG